MPVNRPDVSKRKFISPLIEQQIEKIASNMRDKELANLFKGTFPNTLDTTVTYTKDSDVIPGGPDTFVITGDIPAMWLRDSTGQIRPYISFGGEEEHLDSFLRGVFRRQVHSVNLDGYANAFNYRNNGEGWQRDTRSPRMTKGVFEGKWEIDSLAYVMDNCFRIFDQLCDESLLNNDWEQAMDVIYDIFRYQQKGSSEESKSDKLYYDFARGRAHGGGGHVVRTGLIKCQFRPSDDETKHGFLIPSNAFAVVGLRRTAQLFRDVLGNENKADRFDALAQEVDDAIKRFGLVQSPLDPSKKIFAYEVDGKGNSNLMDDANVPSLLSLPYLEYCSHDDPIYQNTRAFVLSSHNPWYVAGTHVEGVGSPHTRGSKIWAMSIIMRAFTTDDDKEISTALQHIKHSSANTGLLHESFAKSNPSRFSRPWFSWCNSLFGHLIVRLSKTKPYLLFDNYQDFSVEPEKRRKTTRLSRKLVKFREKRKNNQSNKNEFGLKIFE